MSSNYLDNFGERRFIGETLQIFKKPNRMGTREWAETNRILTSEVSSRPGKMDCMQTPWMLYLMECLDDPNKNIIVGKKSAQIAWTETINSFIGRTVDLDPRNIMISFPRAAGCQLFWKEKLLPFIKSTPAIYNKVTKYTKLSRVSHKFIPFGGGFIKLANMGSADEGKSSVIAILIYEEPDGIKGDVNKQGDGLAITRERKKSYEGDWKIIYAGTPTDKDFSQVDMAYEQSNKMVYMVPCHICGESHSLNFLQLRQDSWADLRIDETYGPFNPYSAYYLCPHCNNPWTFEEKNANVLEAINYNNLGWVVTNPEVTDIYGFAFNELLSSFSNSNFVELSKLWLKAKKAYEEGKEGLMKSFVNNQTGEAYAPLHSGYNVEDLRKQRLHYSEGIVPAGAFLLTAGIDVQVGGESKRSRFAICVRAWGRNGNSWLVHWTEIIGNANDYDDNIWERLTDYLTQEWPHASGAGRYLKIEIAAIDSGAVTENVYHYVKDMTDSIDGQRPKFYGQFGSAFYATKGTSQNRSPTGGDRYEIYNDPTLMEATTDAQARKSLAERWGITLYMVGTYKSHEELSRRINLTGNRDRWYFNETSYGKYEEGLLSYRKTYGSAEAFGVWKLIPGRAGEVDSCERLNLYCSHAVGIHLLTNRDWTSLEYRLLQTSKTDQLN